MEIQLALASEGKHVAGLEEIKLRRERGGMEDFPPRPCPVSYTHLPATKGFHSWALFGGIALRAMPVNLTVMTLPPFGSDFPLSHTSLSSNRNIIRCYIKHPER